jgi:ABC-type Fe3+/spermidine/putrescine transport system ATPase subunit
MADLPSMHVLCNGSVGALRIHVQFTVNCSWTVLFGPSGSGKSTLLRSIAGLWQPEESHIRLGKDDLTALPAHRRSIAMVTQRPALFPHLTVRENIAFGCRTTTGRENYLQQVIDNFGLSALQGSRPRTLSGGETQRVALARALASAPRVLLLDEVFTGMHRSQRDELTSRVRGYCAQRGVPVLCVTHDVAEALGADEVILLEDGGVIRQGAPRSMLVSEIDQLRRRLSAVSTPEAP